MAIVISQHSKERTCLRLELKERKAKMKRDQVLWHWAPGLKCIQRIHCHAFQLWELINSILWLKAKWVAFFFIPPPLKIENVLMNLAYTWYVFIIHLKINPVWRSSTSMPLLVSLCCLTNPITGHKELLCVGSLGGEQGLYVPLLMGHEPALRELELPIWAIQ